MSKRETIKLSLLMILTAFVLCYLSVSVAARDNGDIVSPRWTNIHTINVEMAFNDGTGTVTAIASKKAGVNSIEGTLYLYKLINGEWVYINEWYGRKSVGTLAVSGQFICESGVTYKGVFTVVAYGNEITETETVENSRPCP